jgi:hypothetical protein
MGNTPQADANKKAKREMREAVDKVIDEKKKEPIGTKEAEEEVAADLNEAAHGDTKGRRSGRPAPTKHARSLKPNVRSDK